MLPKSYTIQSLDLHQCCFFMSLALGTLLSAFSKISKLGSVPWIHRFLTADV